MHVFAIGVELPDIVPAFGLKPNYARQKHPGNLALRCILSASPPLS
jgi:hypothetical protein